MHPIKRRRDVAAENGADHVIDSAKEDAGYAIKQLTGGRGADVILEMSGYSLALQSSIRGLNKNNCICSVPVIASHEAEKQSSSNAFKRSFYCWIATSQCSSR